MNDVDSLSIIIALRSHRYNFANEIEFQDGIAKVLDEAFIPYQREHDLGENGIIDFFCNGIGVEAKIKGSRAQLMRQVARYAKHESLKSVIVASIRMAQIASFPHRLNDKNITTVFLGSSF